MVKVKLDAKDFIKMFTKRLTDWVNKAVESRVGFIKSISPEASGDYINSHKVSKAKLVGRNIEASNFNDSQHAFGVEFWFRRAPVNWSKEDWVTIYNWVWANVMTRATQNLKKNTFDIINKAIRGW